MVPLLLVLAAGCTDPEPAPEPSSPVDSATSSVTTGETADTGTRWRVVDGDVFLGPSDDLTALLDVQEIRGDLHLEGAPLGTLVLPQLRRVGGALDVWEIDGLSSLDLPLLEDVGGDLNLYDLPQLERMDGLPALQRVGGTVRMHHLDGLHTLALPSLQTAGGLYLYDDPLLDSVELPVLQEVQGAAQLFELPAMRTIELPALQELTGTLNLFQTDALTTLSLPVLEQLGGYELHHADQMQDLGQLPALRTVTGSVTVLYDDQLQTLAGMESLETIEGSLTVKRNPALAALGLPSLQSLARMDVRHNASLPQCVVEALADQGGADQAVCGNNLDDGCIPGCEP